MKITRTRIDKYLRSHSVVVPERTLMNLTRALINVKESEAKTELKEFIQKYRENDDFEIPDHLIEQAKNNREPRSNFNDSLQERSGDKAKSEGLNNNKDSIFTNIINIMLRIKNKTNS